MGQEYTLDGTPVQCRKPSIYIEQFPIADPPGMFLSGGRKPQNPEETQADTQLPEVRIEPAVMERHRALLGYYLPTTLV